MTLRRALVFSCVALFAAMAVWWWQDRGNAIAPLRAPESTGDNALASTSDATADFRFDSEPPTATATTTSSSAALAPALGTPPAQVVAALLPAARRGDAKAQCRIGLELGACQLVLNHMDGLRQALRRGESTADARGDGEFALKLAELELNLTQRREACAALDVDGLVKERDWLLEAARRGHAESALRYLDGQSLGQDSTLRSARIAPWGVMRHPGWAAWQREAPRIADALLDSGQADVLFLLTLAYADDNTPISGLYPNDPVRRAAHQIALQRSEPGRATARDFTEGLSPADVTVARREADALLARLRGGQASMARMEQVLKPTVTALLPQATGPGAPAPCESN